MIEGVSVGGRQVVPEDLAELPPGPELAALLARFDRTRLNGHDLVTLLRARARQVAHDQAQLLADVAEVAHCPPGDADSPAARTEVIDEFSVDEIRMALRLTRRAADTTLGLAVDLYERLPRVHAALLDGTIDLPRARVLSQETGCLPEHLARRVVDQIIDAARLLTTGQLAARIRTLAITVDPAAAHRRQERSLAGRRVVTDLDPDGTATLAGYQLPAARAVGAASRVDALAREARQAGDTRNLDQLRADTFLDLLEGIGHASSAGPVTDNTPAHSTHQDNAQTSHSTAPSDGTSQTAAGTDGPVSPDSPVGPNNTAGPNDPVGRDGTAGPNDGLGRGGVELRVPLTTLMRLTEQPGELAGWGPVIAEIARQIAHRQHRSPWRVSVYDQTGRLVHHGPVRRRPTTTDASFVRARDQTCRAPGCRTPASRTDIDHTHPYADGGATTPRNLGLLCRHDHRLKHEGGWRLRQISDGVFIWRSRLDHPYLIAPEPPFPP